MPSTSVTRWREKQSYHRSDIWRNQKERFHIEEIKQSVVAELLVRSDPTAKWNVLPRT